jgi:hypothetical protein
VEEDKVRFKDFILEKAMNDRTFTDVKQRLGSTAKVGFEFEMSIAPGTDLHNDVQDTRDTMMVSHFDTIDEFTDYFDAARSTWNDITKRFDRWLDEKREEWIDEHWEDYGDEEKDARKEAVADFDEDTITFRDFLKDTFNHNIDFILEYQLDPRFGWYDDDARFASVYVEEAVEGSDLKGTAEEMQASLAKILDEPIIVHDSYHGGKKSDSNWYIEPDSSIQGAPGHHGLELVSPPMLLDKALKDMEKVFKWMDLKDAETNLSTGFHINISVPDIETRLDPVKLVLFMGEEYAKAAFGRESNTFTFSQLKQITDRVRISGRIPSSFSDMQTAAKKYLSAGKHFSVNLGNLEKGYLEFRVAGGEGYHKDPGKAKKMVMRFVTAVDIACDPVMERNEYLKKLTALFNKAGDEAANVTRSNMDQVPEELHRIYKYSPGTLHYTEAMDKSQTTDERRTLLLTLMNHCLETVKSFNTSLNLKEKVYFRKKIKEYSLHSSDADEYFGNQIDRLNFKKEFGV